MSLPRRGKSPVYKGCRILVPEVASNQRVSGDADRGINQMITGQHARCRR